jgi:hypothetical protein
MRIGIELNGVLRDTLGKIIQTYEKAYLEQDTDELPLKQHEGESELDAEEATFTEISNTDDFTYEIKRPINSLNLKEHFAFRNDDELYSFLYEEFPMQIFGHAGSVETFTFNDLNEIYRALRDNHDLVIVSDEIGKSKPASLFFLSKFGCLLEKIKFYSNSTINSMWDEIDILLTANPDLLLNVPNGKLIIKFNQEYNKHIPSKYEISRIKELEGVINTIEND